MTDAKTPPVRNVLVTGSAGLLGRHVVRELQAHFKVSGFDQRRSQENMPQTVGDLADITALRAACQGQGAVVHMAAMPNIWSGPAEKILQVNVVGTWNLLQAAEEAGVTRVILCSSDSVLGFTVMSGAMRGPDYAPVDTAHALRCTDPYGLSKLLGEQVGRSFVDRGKLQVLALRPVFVLYEEMYCEVRARAVDAANYKGPAAGGPSSAGGGPLWHYVDPRDVARAVRLGLQAPSFSGFEALYISAASTLSPEPTLDRLERVTGCKADVRNAEVYRRNPFAPLYDLTRALDVIGFQAQYDLRHLVN